MKPIRFTDLRRFVTVDDWEDKDRTSGKRKGDHHRYIKHLPDGRTLYTRISHGTGSYDDPAVVKVILSRQLEVTEGEFWLAVKKGMAPQRGADEPERSAVALPASLVYNLIAKIGISEPEVSAFSLEWATWVWNYWTAFGEYPPPETIDDWPT